MSHHPIIETEPFATDSAWIVCGDCGAKDHQWSVPVSPEGLDVERLANIAVMALGGVTTGAAFGLYHKSFREHFVARLARADQYRSLAAPAERGTE